MDNASVGKAYGVVDGRCYVVGRCQGGRDMDDTCTHTTDTVNPTKPLTDPVTLINIRTEHSIILMDVQSQERRVNGRIRCNRLPTDKTTSAYISIALHGSHTSRQTRLAFRSCSESQSGRGDRSRSVSSSSRSFAASLEERCVAGGSPFPASRHA